MKKNFKIITIWLLSVLLIIFSINLILNLWIGIKLDTLLNTNTSGYTFDYKKIDISILDRSFLIKEIDFKPEKKSVNSFKNGVFGNTEHVEISGIDIWSLLSSNEINAGKIIVASPSVTFYKNNKEEKDVPKNDKPFKKILNIAEIIIKNGSFKNIDSNKKIVLQANNISLNVKKIVYSEKTSSSKIPFLFDTYTFDSDSIYYHSDEFYDFKTKKISISNSDMKVKNFEMIPLYSRRNFVKKIPMERDLYTISCPEIDVKNMNWGFNKSQFFFKTQSILLNKATANIYRNKLPKDNLSKKKLYNEMLRELKVNLIIDTLKVKNSLLVYEEEVSFEKGPGKLLFDDFNLSAINIESGLGKNKLKDLKIMVNCNFMKTSPLKIDWSLNVLDKSEGFKIKGTIINFDVEKINTFSLPYINVKVDGIFDKVAFDLVGNDDSSSGKFAIEYDDLKVVIFKNDKNERKKNKFLTAIGNLFVKKDSKEKLKSVEVKVDRIKEKSFYNFLWLNIAEGLKKTLI